MDKNFNVNEWTPLSDFVSDFNDKNVFGDGVNRIPFEVDAKLVEEVIDPKDILLYKKKKLIRNTGTLKERITDTISNQFVKKIQLKEQNKIKAVVFRELGFVILNLFYEDRKSFDLDDLNQTKFLFEQQLESHLEKANIEVPDSFSASSWIKNFLNDERNKK